MKILTVEESYNAKLPDKTAYSEPKIYELDEYHEKYLWKCFVRFTNLASLVFIVHIYMMITFQLSFLQLVVNVIPYMVFIFIILLCDLLSYKKFEKLAGEYFAVTFFYIVVYALICSIQTYSKIIRLGETYGSFQGWDAIYLIFACITGGLCGRFRVYLAKKQNTCWLMLHLATVVIPLVLIQYSAAQLLVLHMTSVLIFDTASMIVQAVSHNRFYFLIIAMILLLVNTAGNCTLEYFTCVDYRQ